MNTCPKQAAALEAIYAMPMTDDRLLAVIQCLREKVGMQVARNTARHTSDNVIDVALNQLDDLVEIIEDQQRQDAQEEARQERELPYMPATIGASDQRSWV